MLTRVLGPYAALNGVKKTILEVVDMTTMTMTYGNTDMGHYYFKEIV
jgi:hypothetical protein